MAPERHFSGAEGSRMSLCSEQHVHHLDLIASDRTLPFRYQCLYASDDAGTPMKRRTVTYQTVVAQSEYKKDK